MKYMIYKILPCSLLLIIVACSDKKPEFQGAILVNVHGTVIVKKADMSEYTFTKSDTLTQKALVKQDDIITTAKDSSVDLQFSKALSLRVGQNSTITISSVLLNSKTNQTNLKIAMQKGKLMVKTDKLDSSSDISVSSPTLVASVRGTEFLINANELNNILVDSGSVELSKRDIPTDMPEEPNLPVEPDEPNTDNQQKPTETVIIDEGNKGEADDEEIIVSPLDEEDKEELSQMQEGLEFINDTTRQRLDEIVSGFEAEKERITKDFDQQVEKNRESFDNESRKQKDTFQSEKNKITGEGDARSQMDRIKQGGQ